MFFFKSLNSQSASEGDKESTLFGRLRDKWPSKSDEELQYITGIAGILGSVAFADVVLAPTELERIARVLTDKAGLSPQQAQDVLDVVTSEKTELLAVEVHLYYRMLREICDLQQRMEVLDAMFRVAEADGDIGVDEERRLKELSRGMKIDDRAFIEVKRRFARSLKTVMETT